MSGTGNNHTAVASIDTTKQAGALVLVNTDSSRARYPTYSHSRKSLLYSTEVEDNVYKLWIANADGTQVNELTSSFLSAADIDAHWSYNDEFIAYISSANRYALSTHDMIIMKVHSDEEQSRKIASGITAYAWSPIDNRIAMIQWDTSLDSSGLYILGTDGSQKSFFSAKSIPGMGPASTNLAWSPDGRYIAITGVPNEMNPLTGVQTTVEEVITVNVETGKVEQLAEKQLDLVERNIRCLRWSPDTHKILFVADYTASNKQSRQGALVIVDTQQSTEIQIADHLDWSCPAWSPSGHEVAFVMVDNPQNYYGDIFVANIDAESVRRLTNDTRPKYDLSW